MATNRVAKAGDSQVEVMLKDLVGSPPILARFRVVHILPIGQDLALPRVERPNEDDFVFAPSAVGSGESIVQGLVVGNAKLEGDSLFRESKGFGGILL